MILDGTSIAQRMIERVKMALSSADTRPVLSVIQIGELAAGAAYSSALRKLSSISEMVDFRFHALDASATEDEIVALIERLNSDESVHGILVQLPLPKQFDLNRIASAVAVEKDVDGINPQGSAFVSCTAKACMKLVSSVTKVEGKRAVVVGKSRVVGKPVAKLLAEAGAHVSVLDSSTADISSETRQADILVVAAGHAGLIDGFMVKKGAVVIDVGINRIEDANAAKRFRLVGDVDFDSVKKKAAYVTPVPGGVGPVTVACLLENLCNAAGIDLQN